MKLFVEVSTNAPYWAIYNNNTTTLILQWFTDFYSHPRRLFKSEPEVVPTEALSIDTMAVHLRLLHPRVR